MGLFDAIFGGSSQSSSSTQQSQSQSSAESFIDPFSAAMRQNFMRRANVDIFGGGGLADYFVQDLLRQQQGLIGDAAGLIGESVGPEAAQAQIGALNQQLDRSFNMGLNQIQSRFGTSGSIGSRASIAGAELAGQTDRARSLGIADILGRQSALGLQGANLLGGLSQQTAGLFNTAAAPLTLGNLIYGPTPILSQASSASSGFGTSSGSGSSTPGILGALGGLF